MSNIRSLSAARQVKVMKKTKMTWALGHVELAIESLQPLKDVEGVPTAIIQLQRLQRQLAAKVNKK